MVSFEHSSFSHRYFCTPASRIFSSNFLEGFLIVIVLELLIIILFISSAKIRKSFEYLSYFEPVFFIIVYQLSCLSIVMMLISGFKFQDSSCNWWQRQKERVTALGVGSGSKRDRERCKSVSDALTFSNILI